MNKAAMAFGRLKFDYVKGPRTIIGPCKVGATEYFTNIGAKFVDLDGSRYIEVADEGSSNLFGWAITGALTSSGTDGASELMVDTSPWSLYYIPANSTVDITMRGKAVDLVADGATTALRIRADVTAGADDLITVQDVDIKNTRVLVRMSYAVVYNASIA